MNKRIIAAVAGILVGLSAVWLIARTQLHAPPPSPPPFANHHVGAAAAPFWGRTTDTFSSDANHTAPVSILNFHEISVSGTQTNKQYIVPLVAGQEWLISNNTTSQFTVIGATGTGVPIDKGGRVLVHCNGTNILGAAESVGDKWQNDYDAAGAKMPIPGSEVCTGEGTNFRVCNVAAAANTSDAVTWTTLAQFAPAAGTGRACDAKFAAWDQGPDAGIMLGNAVSCSMQFLVTDTYNGVINITPQAGLSNPSAVAQTLVCVAATSVWDAGLANDSGTAGQTVSQQFRVLNSSGIVQVQVLGPNTNTWTNHLAMQCMERAYP